jgi:cyanate permease
MKHTVEKSFQLLMPFVFTTAMMYCIGAFCSASWNLADWTFNLRSLMALWAVVFGVALLLRLEQTRDR